MQILYCCYAYVIPTSRSKPTLKKQKKTIKNNNVVHLRNYFGYLSGFITCIVFYIYNTFVFN